MIGVFDSGLGGLSVLAAIARSLPSARLIYFADTAHLPYGNKPDAFIRDRVLAIGDDLVARGCTTLVAACNTATAAAVEALRQAHPDLAVIGIEPGVKPAALSSQTRHIAVLATESTARSARLQALIATYATPLGVRVHIEPCPGWATRIEMLEMDHPEFVADIAARILPIVDKGIDRIVLGCTHYAFLAPKLQPLIDGRSKLVDVADAVAREVVRRSKVEANDGTHGEIQLIASARPERLQIALKALGLDTYSPFVDRLRNPPTLS